MEVCVELYFVIVCACGEVNTSGRAPRVAVERAISRRAMRWGVARVDRTVGHFVRLSSTSMHRGAGHAHIHGHAKTYIMHVDRCGRGQVHPHRTAHESPCRLSRRVVISPSVVTLNEAACSLLSPAKVDPSVVFVYGVTTAAILCLSVEAALETH